MSGQGTSSKAEKQADKKAKKARKKDIKVDSNIFIHFYNSGQSEYSLVTYYIICYLLPLLFAGSQVHAAICSSLPVIVAARK